MTIRSLKQWEKGYIAGCLDSDGYIGITYDNASPYIPTVTITGSYRQIDKLISILGIGNISRCRNSHVIAIPRVDIKHLLKKVYPFLSKKRKAELIFKLLKLNQACPKDLVQAAKLYHESRMLSSHGASGRTTKGDEFRETLIASLKSKATGNPEPSLNSIKEGAETNPDSDSVQADRI